VTGSELLRDPEYKRLHDRCREIARPILDKTGDPMKLLDSPAWVRANAARTRREDELRAARRKARGRTA
jgi:hypothetical protein